MEWHAQVTKGETLIVITFNRAGADSDGKGMATGDVSGSFPQHAILRGLFVRETDGAQLDPAYYYYGNCSSDAMVVGRRDSEQKPLEPALWVGRPVVPRRKAAASSRARCARPPALCACSAACAPSGDCCASSSRSGSGP